MRRKLMIIGMILCLLMVPMSAWADSSEFTTAGSVQPRYTYVNVVHTMLSINSSGVATCVVSIDENPDNPFTYSKLTVYIKKSSNDSTVKTFTATKYSTNGYFTWSDTYKLTAKGTYYIKAVNKLYKNGNLVETITTSSVTDTY